MGHRLVNAQPGNSSIVIQLAKSYRGLGSLLAKTGHINDADETYRKGLQLLDSVLAKGVSDPEANALRLSLRQKLGLARVEVVVLEVMPGGQAHHFGLAKGDVFVRYAGQSVTSTDQFAELVDSASDSLVELEARREGNPLKLMVKAGSLGAVLEDRGIAEKTPP